MTVQEVAELAYRQMTGGDPSSDSGFELKDFEYAVEQARAYKIRYDYFNTIRFEGERVINNLWLKEFKNVPVSFDKETNTYYSLLPAEVVDLPHSLGLYLVCPMQNYQKPFAPQTIGEAWLFTRNPSDYITYHYDSDKIYYDNFDPVIKSVYVQLIPLTNDDIPNEFAYEITDLVLNRFLKTKQIPEDKLDNSSPNKTEIANG